MQTFLISALALGLSGLGFITYKHPITARKIILVLLAANFIIYVGFVIYFQGEAKSLAESQNVILSQLHDTTKLTEDMVTGDAKQDLYTETLGSLSQIQKAHTKTNDIIFKIFTIALGALLVLYILSFLFENIWKKEIEK